ncbi:S-adenosylmethionine decarboxylase proenzyme [Desulfurispirillum indicum S5]|uniref:S-adenosylmethionine decarboxylase proenzyme n=1 Tax=Desulfurispirillum indicum (strain ATCC BAA-1389 / DSM 22839 / S5) TaxID=653733 RepID=E6W3R8_DESIS|nr:adenosylmethionine decarboxylase [Desulfurispirillum indicum]ADU66949.1 S-adenosylmethionine decarboxylase proenzyme [Desulfurispirillum indicum S5]
MVHALAKHIIVEFYNCNPQIIGDVVLIQQHVEGAITFSTSSIEESFFQPTPENGANGTVITADIRVSIHTWPSHSYAAVDIFTPSNTIDPWLAYDYLKERLEAQYDSATELRRGQIKVGQGSPFQRSFL